MKDILPELNGKEYIEQLYKSYDIHFCRIDEVDELVVFLSNYWRNDHIFTYSREVLDFQHKDCINSRYNFVLAKDKGSDEIHSVLGFVPTYQFDSEIKRTEVWPCIWKSRDDVHVKGLGVSLYHYLKEHIKIETISILGISEIALGIYKHWNFETGKIEQYFFPNYRMQKYQILGGNTKFEQHTKSDCMTLREMSQAEFEAVSDIELLSLINNYKSKKYYINRFFRHPVYQYKFFSVADGKVIKLIFVARICHAKQSKCIRIVDCIGNIEALSGISCALQNYLYENQLEYIDFVEVGLNADYFIKAGFINRKAAGTIVPNYFEPFLKENVDLDYAYKTVLEKKEPVFFKADADQDRPNILS